MFVQSVHIMLMCRRRILKNVPIIKRFDMHFFRGHSGLARIYIPIFLVLKLEDNHVLKTHHPKPAFMIQVHVQWLRAYSVIRAVICNLQRSNVVATQVLHGIDIHTCETSDKRHLHDHAIIYLQKAPCTLHV